MKDIELVNIVGGAGWGFWSIFGGVLTFALGFFEGIINPMQCGK